MTRLVWLTKCPYVPQASPSATNTVNWRNSLDILFSLRSSSSIVRSSPLHYDSPIISKNPNGIKSLLENAPQDKSQPTQYKISKIRVRAVISVNILREQPFGTLKRCRFFHKK